MRHLILTDVGEHLDQLVTAPLLSRLSSLDLTGNPIGDAGVETLIRSPHLTKLRYLSLSRCDIGAPGAEMLAAAQTLPNLRYLDFVGNQVELTPRPAAQDAISGELVEVAFPPLGRKLVQLYGPKPWITFTSPDPRELYFSPDVRRGLIVYRYRPGADRVDH